MSDDDVETFETTDAGASLVYPMQAGSVRKGGFMVIKGRPTKVGKLLYFYAGMIQTVVCGTADGTAERCYAAHAAASGFLESAFIDRFSG